MQFHQDIYHLSLILLPLFLFFFFSFSLNIYYTLASINFIGGDKKIPLDKRQITYFFLLQDEFLSNLKALLPELCVTAAYGNILPTKFLKIPASG